MKDGVLLMSMASILTLLYTHGDITTLVLMYSINVFLTFSLSESAMVRYWIRHRKKYPDWSRHILIHIIGLTMCLTILCVNVYEKFSEGGWLTLTVTAVLIGVCFWIKSHYGEVRQSLKRLDEVLGSLPLTPAEPPKPEPTAHTAVLLVGGFSGLGVHSLLSIQRLFPNHFKNFIFESVGVIDSATFKGVEEVEEVRHRTEDGLKSYVALAGRLRLAADHRMGIGTEAVAEAERLCIQVGKEFPRSVFFAGKLVFQEEKWFQRILHNETAYQLQRRLQFAGLNAMVLPVRVLNEAPAVAPAQRTAA
jgi:hypothetical protein